MKFAAVLALGLILSSHVRASDHIDGPVTMKHRVADLSDFYAFPTPNKPGSLTLILNSYPIVPGNGHYDDKVSYVITLRKASISGAGDKAFIATDAEKERQIRCTFVTPHSHDGHVAKCVAGEGMVAEAGFNQVGEAKPGEPMRLFAGMRTDPFFFNSDWATAASTKGKILPPKDDNVMNRINVLSLVMEVDLAKLFGGSVPMVAVAAEAFAQDNPQAPVRRMDRLGRPEITNVSLVAGEGAADLRDQYNLDQPFRVSKVNQDAYRERLVKNIAYYDALDGKKVWTDADRDLLANLLVDDFLLVDLAKPCTGSTFLEIEKALVAHKPHQSCGGRLPDDDIMDVLFTLYIAGLNGERVRDGVDAPARPASSAFPYLQEPDLSVIAKGKAFLARKILGI